MVSRSRLTTLLITTVIAATAAAITSASSVPNIVVATSNDKNGGGIGIESGFRAVYNGYKQCESEADTLSCLKLKALKLVDRALSINNIPITEAISLAKREDNRRSLNEQWTDATTANAPATDNAIDDFGSGSGSGSSSIEGDDKLNDLLWKRLEQFVESRSLQLRVNKLLFGGGGYGDGGNVEGGHDYDYDYDENANDVRQSAVKFRDENVNVNANANANATATDQNESAWKKTTAATATARGKKDKNKGMYMYMMMMKGGMMALAYKGLALLAGKALLVSKIALTLALLVAIKKLFSGGHHSQKTTYEIVKTPIITHSHQYGGGGGGGAIGAGNPQNGHYATDYAGYDGGPFASARSLDEPWLMQQQQQQQQRSRITLKAVDATTDADSRYTTTRTATTGTAAAAAASSALARARSLVHRQTVSDGDDYTDQRLPHFNIPYAHLAAYRKQLTQNTTTLASALKNDVSGSVTATSSQNATN